MLEHTPGSQWPRRSWQPLPERRAALQQQQAAPAGRMPAGQIHQG